MIHEQVCCCDEAANHQLPIAVPFWIIWIVSMEECSSLRQNLMQIHCSTCSVILNVMVTQYTCSLNGICCPHWLVQWSHHCPHMCIPAHSLRLPGYVDIPQTILVILAMAGPFPGHTSCNSSIIRTWTHVLLIPKLTDQVSTSLSEPSTLVLTHVGIRPVGDGHRHLMKMITEEIKWYTLTKFQRQK